MDHPECGVDLQTRNSRLMILFALISGLRTDFFAKVISTLVILIILKHMNSSHSHQINFGTIFLNSENMKLHDPFCSRNWPEMYKSLSANWTRVKNGSEHRKIPEYIFKYLLNVFRSQLLWPGSIDPFCS